MFADHLFKIGDSHEVCEDYALSGVFQDLAEEPQEYPFAMIGDGCSGAPHTDFGARFIIRAAREWLPYRYDADKFGHSVITTSKGYARTLTMPTESLSSTLLLTVADEDSFRTTVYGDGTYGFRRRDGFWELYDFDFTTPLGESAPYYLRYEIDQKSKRNYLANATGKCVVTRMTWDDISDPETLKKESWEESVEADDLWYHQASVERADYDMAIVCSDGLGAFTVPSPETGNPQKVPIERVLEQTLCFKACNGQFVKRRLNRAFDKNYPACNWTHLDDVSIAGIYDPGKKK